jgi:cobalt-zinc-cadmium resistance protein CzcA
MREGQGSSTTALVDNPDTVEGIVLLQKGDDSDPVLEGIHEEVKS